jgi:hypothetical protein
MTQRHGPKPLRERAACKHGHDLTVPGAIVVYGGRPHCRACAREACRWWRRNHRKQWNSLMARYRRKVTPSMGQYHPREVWEDPPRPETIARLDAVLRELMAGSISTSTKNAGLRRRMMRGTLE